jgi:excisionase family DNA binding protein
MGDVIQLSKPRRQRTVDVRARVAARRGALRRHRGWYSTDEMAAMAQICRGTVYKAIRLGQIPAWRVGRRWVIPAHAIEWMLGPPNRDDGA